jgi:recombinational DNA repair ATPase RecF
MQATDTTTRTSRQELARLLRTRQYAGCRGQVSFHGCHRASIQLFRGDTLVADLDYRSAEWGMGPLVVHD